MGAPVTHYEIWVDEPSESDPDGYSVLACGADFAHKTTATRAEVTCKRCLRELNKTTKGTHDHHQ